MDYNKAKMQTRGYIISSVYYGEMGVKANSNDTAPPVQRAIDKEQCFVKGIYAFILRVSSIFGTAPLRFTRRGVGYDVSLSQYMRVYSYLLFTVIGATFYAMVSDMKRDKTAYSYMSSSVFRFVSGCDFIVVVTISGVGVYGSPSRMRGMSKVMGTMDSVDKTIGALYSDKKDRRIWLTLVVFLLYTALVVDKMISLCTVSHDVDVLLHYLGIFMLGYLIMFLEFQFVYTALAVWWRFKAINEALALTAKHVSKTQNAKILEPLGIITETHAQTNSQSKKTTAIIRKSGTGELKLAVPPSEVIFRLASLYSELCDVVDRINDSYGLPLVVMMVSRVFHLIITPYFAILTIEAREGDAFNVFLSEFPWFILHLLLLLTVMEPCHYTMTEGQKTEGAVCRMLLKAPTSGALPERLELFLHQLVQQRLRYNPMGLCTLGRQLIAEIFGVVVSYLVILIQFQKRYG